MSELKHTPGPWELSEEGGGHRIRMGEAIENSFSYESHLVLDYDHTLYRDLDGDQFKEAEANARLIAAAPELLDACTKTLNAIRNCRLRGEEPGETELLLVAAIEKATGEAP